MMANLDELATRIARKHFSVETLETRNRDSLDFHDVAVWDMKAALLEAYRAGREGVMK